MSPGPRRPVAARLVALGLAAPAIALAGGCSDEPGHAPVVRITLTPAYLPVGDDHHTDVTLDGTASSDDLDPPDAGAPLAYAWTLDDASARIVSGDRESGRLVVRFAGGAPTRVRLVVTTPSGVRGEASAWLGVTLPDGGQ